MYIFNICVNKHMLRRSSFNAYMQMCVCILYVNICETAGYLPLRRRSLEMPLIFCSGKGITALSYIINRLENHS